MSKQPSAETRSKDGPVRKVVIVGGGTAGWMTAAGLSRLFGGAGVEIELVESDEIGTVGVGEATLPHLRYFNERLGINEAEFMARTQATFKLGIEFVNWGRIGDSYIHPFGDYGEAFDGVAFHHQWMADRTRGSTARIDDYSLPILMSEAGRFAFPDRDPRSIGSTFGWAYQLDASLYARYLRSYAEARGTRRTEGRIVDVSLWPEDGFVRSVTLTDGRAISGDLFIDCSGFRGLLIEQALKAGYEDWSDVLPCNSAVAVPCEARDEIVPYTRATAREAGWQWRIPLQHRIGNGYVFCNDYISDEAATETLLANVEGKLRADPKVLRFKTGKRKLQWSRNCVAVGLSSGFLEPLESTSIYLIQQAITVLAEVWPERAMDPVDRDEFNRVMDLEYERVRDFLVLHYHATERDDTDFWNYVRTMPIPDSLSRKMELFRKRGVVETYKDGLFLHPSWIAVYLGQRVVPETVDPRAHAMAPERLGARLADLRTRTQDTVGRMPRHMDTIAQYCPAPQV